MSAYRNMTTLRNWLAEFDELHYPIAGAVRVIEQDGSDGANTGLVRVRLMNASTGAYIQPTDIGSTKWIVTMEARTEAIDLRPADLMRLASELTTVSALCAFLQAKSSEYVVDDQD